MRNHVDKWCIKNMDPEREDILPDMRCRWDPWTRPTSTFDISKKLRHFKNGLAGLSGLSQVNFLSISQKIRHFKNGLSGLSGLSQ
jgi:hypothetical protein